MCGNCIDTTIFTFFSLCQIFSFVFILFFFGFLSTELFWVLFNVHVNVDVSGCMCVCDFFLFIFFTYIFCALPIFTFKIWFDSNHNSHHSIQFYRNAFKTMQNYLSVHFVCMYSSFVPLNLILTVCSINTLQCSMFNIHIDLILNDKNEINGEKKTRESKWSAFIQQNIVSK